MTPDTYKQKIARLSLSQEEAGILLGGSARTGQRWASEGPPIAVAMLLLVVDSRDQLQRLYNRAIKPK